MEFKKNELRQTRTRYLWDQVRYGLWNTNNGICSILTLH